jgi:D-serine deaminase-like pyridoxal phosphate-dependent protein
MAALPGLQFEGIMGYEGHAVMIPDMNERQEVTGTALDQLLYARDLLQQDGIPVPIVSAGGTGTYHITGRRQGITELQAGSYATMDAKYQSVGADFELALSVVARVISVPTPDLAIIDAGHKAMTVEFGLPQLVKPEGWAIATFSEEHAKLRRHGGAPLKRGDRVEIVPSHGCTTINLHDAYHVTRNDVLEAIWPIEARGHIR